jgi:hypothetical protein
MKKLLAITTAALLTVSAMSATALAADTSSVKLVVNGETVDFTGDQEPVVKDGRTLVPFRAAFEKMGATVNWDNDARLCEAYYGDLYVGIKIDSKDVLLSDGKTVESDVPAQIINGRTMVPLRVLSEGIGAKVDWDNATKTATVTTSDIQDTATDKATTSTNNGDYPAKVTYTEKTATVTGKVSKVTYTYPVVTDVYSAADQLNKNIESLATDTAQSIADENGIGGDITIELEIMHNGGGLFSVMYLVNGEDVNRAHYHIADGAKMSDGGYQYALNNDGDYRFDIEDYTVTEKSDIGDAYISATVYYPQFTETGDNIDDVVTAIGGINYQLQKSAQKGVDSFIASYKDDALKLYESGAKVGVYNFFEDCEVEISDDNIATIKTHFTESVAGKEDRENDDEYSFNLTTGEPIE